MASQPPPPIPADAELPWLAAAFNASLTSTYVTKVQTFNVAIDPEHPLVTLVFGNAIEAPIGRGGAVVREAVATVSVLMDPVTVQGLVDAIALGFGIKAKV